MIEVKDLQFDRPKPDLYQFLDAFVCNAHAQAESWASRILKDTHAAETVSAFNALCADIVRRGDSYPGTCTHAVDGYYKIRAAAAPVELLATLGALEAQRSRHRRKEKTMLGAFLFFGPLGEPSAIEAGAAVGLMREGYFDWVYTLPEWRGPDLPTADDLLTVLLDRNLSIERSHSVHIPSAWTIVQ